MCFEPSAPQTLTDWHLAEHDWCDNADRGRCLIIDTVIHPNTLL